MKFMPKGAKTQHAPSEGAEKGDTPMTEGIKRRNTIRDMQKRTIGEALYSKKLGRKPNASAKKIGVMPQGQSKGEEWH